MSDLPTDITMEPIFVVEATYAPDAAETRVPFRPEHLAGIIARKRAGVYIEAGAYADMTASLILVRAPDAAAAIALVSDDVYMRNGVWVEVRARGFGRVTAGGDAD
ncbi:MAG: YciI family protein [Chloroflexota bacterium]